MNTEGITPVMTTPSMKAFLTQVTQSGYVGCIHPCVAVFICVPGHVPCGVGVACAFRPRETSWNDTKHAAGLQRGIQFETLT
jgi:hypothetical protein